MKNKNDSDANAPGMGSSMGAPRNSGGIGMSASQEEKPGIHFNVFGDVTLVRKGKRSKLKEGETENILQDGDRLITGESSYVWGISDMGGMSPEQASLSLLPNSEAALSVRASGTAHKIARIELVRGLFQVSISTDRGIPDKLVLPSGYPKVEFKPLFGEFRKHKQCGGFIELNNDGSLTLFMLMNRVAYGGVETDLTSVPNPKITVAKDGLYVTNLVKYPDQRVEAAKNSVFALAEYLNALLMKRELERLKQEKTKEAPSKKVGMAGYIQVLQKELVDIKATGDPSLVAMVEARIASAKAATELPGENDEEAEKRRIAAMEKQVAKLGELERKAKAPLPHYSPLGTEDRLSKKDIKRLSQSYEALVGELRAKEEELAEKHIGTSALSKATPQSMLALELGSSKAREDFKAKIKEAASQKGLAALTKSADINEKFTYGGADYVATKAEKGTELRFQKSPRGKEFLAVHMTITNTTGKEIFLDPAAAYTLIADGSPLKAENYTISTNLDPGKSTEGYLLYLVPEDAKDFKFQYGTSCEQKKEITLRLR